MNNSINFDGLKGISAISLNPNTVELAITGTDVSFTIIKRDLHELKPGAFFWIADLADVKILVEWIGNDSQFVEDTRQLIATWINNNRRRMPIIMPFKVMSNVGGSLRAKPMFSPEMDIWTFTVENNVLIIRTKK